MPTTEPTPDGWPEQWNWTTDKNGQRYATNAVQRLEPIKRPKPPPPRSVGKAKPLGKAKPKRRRRRFFLL